jgi:hypothetical protein
MVLCDQCLASARREGELDPVSPVSGAGKAAQRAAIRGLVWRAVQETNWNLTRAAQLLGVRHAASVLRWVLNVGLHAEYEKAKRAGLITPAWNKGRGEVSP